MGVRGERAAMWMALVAAAEAGAAGEVPVGAVIREGNGRYLAEAGNGSVGARDPTAHAEIVAMRLAALRMANYRLPGVVLSVTLEPCAMCRGAFEEARIAHVRHAAPRQEGGAGGADEEMMEPSLDLLRKFFEKRRGS